MSLPNDLWIYVKSYLLEEKDRLSTIHHEFLEIMKTRNHELITHPDFFIHWTEFHPTITWTLFQSMYQRFSCPGIKLGNTCCEEGGVRLYPG
jgi:hypothetical protein